MFAICVITFYFLFLLKRYSLSCTSLVKGIIKRFDKPKIVKEKGEKENECE